MAGGVKDFFECFSFCVVLLLSVGSEGQQQRAFPPRDSLGQDWRPLVPPETPRPDFTLRATLFNFTDPEDPVQPEWLENSDSAPIMGGSSKGAMEALKTPEIQRVVFFGMVENLPGKRPVPEPGFAGMYTKTNYDLSFFTGLKVRARAQGIYSRLTMVVFDEFGEMALENNKAHPVAFEATTDLTKFNEFVEVDYKFEDFQPYVYGKPETGAGANKDLNLTRTTGIGFKVYGNLLGTNQGIGSFEIDSIVAYRNANLVVPPKPDNSKLATLIDFTGAETTTSWYENSDSTEMENGKSVASMDIFEVPASGSSPAKNRHAVFFGLLNLQPDKSGFAGVKKDVGWDLTGYNSMKIRMRAKGEFANYKVILYDEKYNPNFKIMFTSFFKMENNNEWIERDFPLSEFRNYVTNDKALPEPRLNTKDIRGISFMMFGGKGCDYAGQKGPSSLQIGWIKAVKK